MTIRFRESGRPKTDRPGYEHRSERVAVGGSFAIIISTAAAMSVISTDLVEAADKTAREQLKDTGEADMASLPGQAS